MKRVLNIMRNPKLAHIFVMVKSSSHLKNRYCLHHFVEVFLNFCALVDEIFTRDSAGSGFKLCDLFLVSLEKKVSHVLFAYISF